MKEIDTETPVVWPAWCYSGNIPSDVLKQSPPRRAAISLSLSSSASTSSSSSSSSSSDTGAGTATAAVAVAVGVTNKFGRSSVSASSSSSSSKRKNHFTTKQLRSSSGSVDCLDDPVSGGSALTAILQSNRGSQTQPKRTQALPRSSSNQNACTSSTSNVANTTVQLQTTLAAYADKMLSDRSMLLSGFNALESNKKLCDNLATVKAPTTTTTTTTTTTATATASDRTPPPRPPSAYLFLEKVKNEAMTPSSAAVTTAQMDTLKDAMELANTKIALSNNNNNNNNNNSSNNNLISNATPSATASGSSNSNNNSNSSNHNHQHHHGGGGNTNSVKRERLSPGTNGDMQSSISRSRSATPSSFRGTPPHSVTGHHNPTAETAMVPMQGSNMSTNLLTTIQQAGRNAAADFSTRNYSDFMRSLAAKYNNTNPNDTPRRNAFFDNNSNNNKMSPAANKASQSSSLKKEAPPPPLRSLSPPAPPLPAEAVSSALKSQNSQNMAAAAAAAAVAAAAGAGTNNSTVSPFMTSLLSSLPFSQGVFPPLIDMSSTQALVTLARAAKEAEIQSILRNAQKRPSMSSVHSNSASSSPRPNLSAALQQAAQFVSPALLYSAQLQQHHQQQHHHHHHHHHQTSRQSSPIQVRSTGSSSSALLRDGSPGGGEKTMTASPLDLSSQPLSAKRFKAESTSSQGSSNADCATKTPVQQRLSVDAVASNSTTSAATTTTTMTTGHSQTSPPTPPHQIRPASKSPAFSEATAATRTPNEGGAGTLSRGLLATVSPMRQCQAQSDEVNAWTVDDVCTFVGSIDICAEYVQNFRDQCIDGSGLPLLTEDHLMNSLGMKLGPALKLRSMLSKKLGGPCPCVSCISQAQLLAAQAMAAAAASSPMSSTTTTAAATGGISPHDHHHHLHIRNTANNNNNSNSNKSYHDNSPCGSGNANNSAAAAPTTTASTISNNLLTTQFVHHYHHQQQQQQQQHHHQQQHLHRESNFSAIRPGSADSVS